MQITLQTAVEKSHLQVMEGFTESLFSRLAPPFPPVKVLRFDGCKAGDIVDLELNFIFSSKIGPAKSQKITAMRMNFYL